MTSCFYTMPLLMMNHQLPCTTSFSVFYIIIKQVRSVPSFPLSTRGYDRHGYTVAFSNRLRRWDAYNIMILPGAVSPSHRCHLRTVPTIYTKGSYGDNLTLSSSLSCFYDQCIIINRSATHTRIGSSGRTLSDDFTGAFDHQVPITGRDYNTDGPLSPPHLFLSAIKTGHYNGFRILRGCQ